MDITDAEIEQLLNKKFQGEFFSGGFHEHHHIFDQKIQNIRKKITKTIIIGGTNGKGETTRAISFILTENKVSHAMLTSPHIERVNERFSFNGKFISNKELYLYLNQAIEETLNVALSYYELLFYVFLLWLENLSLEVLVLEVGLGGRLDSVNYFDADLAIITSISRDHCELLGNRHDLILKEKIAIAREGKILLTAFTSRYLANLTKKIALKNGYEWQDMICLDTTFIEQHYSKRNWLTAVLGLELIGKNLPISEVKYESFKPKFRMSEALDHYPFLYFFPGHNLEGFREYRRYSDSIFKGRIIETIVISFSKRPESEALSILKILSQVKANKIILTCFEHFKAMPETMIIEIYQKLKQKDKIYFDRNWQQHIQKSEVSLVCGSNYFLGHVCKKLT